MLWKSWRRIYVIWKLECARWDVHPKWTLWILLMESKNKNKNEWNIWFLFYELLYYVSMILLVAIRSDTMQIHILFLFSNCDCGQNNNNNEKAMLYVVSVVEFEMGIIFIHLFSPWEYCLDHKWKQLDESFVWLSWTEKRNWQHQQRRRLRMN